MLGAGLKFGTEDIVLVNIAALTLDINDLKPLSAPVPHLTDPAPASTAECAITCNVPHREAINTSHWAALATCPDTIFPNANSSMPYHIPEMQIAVFRRIQDTLRILLYPFKLDCLLPTFFLYLCPYRQPVVFIYLV